MVKKGEVAKGSSVKGVKAPIKGISLFSGALGLDIGMEQAGIEIRLALDIDHAACETIRLNKPTLPVIEGDIADVSGDDVLMASNLDADDIDVIVGGPPCQAFSIYGKRRGTGDVRGQATLHYLRMISEIKPKAFVMENVRGLLSMKTAPTSEKGSLFTLIQSSFEDIGYRTDTYVVNSVNYGAPQIRERIIVIGNRLGRYAEFPKPTHSNRPDDGLLPLATLGDALMGFQDPDPSKMDFSDRKKKYLAMVPPGGNWRSLPLDIQKESMGKTWYLKGGRSAYWRKLSLDFPCPTIVTMPNHAGTSMCHPSELRALTVGECAHIQGFPAEWKFFGTPSEKYRQIGNAVPVVLGKMAGLSINKLLSPSEQPNGISIINHRIIHLRPHVRTRWWWKNGEVVNPTPYYQEVVKSSSPIDKGQLKIDDWASD